MVMYLNFLTDELIGSFGTYAGVLERVYEGIEPARTVATLLNEESQDRPCLTGESLAKSRTGSARIEERQLLLPERREGVCAM